MFPLFLDLRGRLVVLVGGGAVADAKRRQLADAGADVRIVPPDAFTPSDLDGAWLVVAAATPAVNRAVADAAAARHLFVNAVDDPAHATAYLSGVVRRGGVTIGISTDGVAPALTALVREALDVVLPSDVGEWVTLARDAREAWKRERVSMEARKPLLLEALNAIYCRKAAGQDGSRKSCPAAVLPSCNGHVSLVGAGPGDPGLLTRTAVARLRAADLVLYDALIDRRILRYARRAQKFFVGKRAGRHAMPQPSIHGLMIRAARRGRRVVRLKGGDPFLFGRGGEEALALQRAGVSYDIVPGITSAVAAPAAAGIPLTHRGSASGVIVVSGHDERAFADAMGAVRPGVVTVVILMGLARTAALASALIDRGWRRGTPAAVVVDATTPRQQTWRGTLDDLASARAEFDVEGPGTIVVGDVVAVLKQEPVANVSVAQAFGPAERTHVSR